VTIRPYTKRHGRAFMVKRMEESAPVVTDGPAGTVPETGPVDFESFFRSEHARLLRAMYVVTGSPQEAEELMQEAFLRTWERWDRVGGMDDPAGYLYRSAMNLFRSHYRRARVALRRASGTAHSRDEFALSDERDAIARAMRRLAPRQRAAIVLTEWLGYGSEEAGRMLGVRPATIRALAYQARAALRHTLEDDRE
jgi:RNA polymerase sigma factor (sigma-70 family)